MEYIKLCHQLILYCPTILKCLTKFSLFKILQTHHHVSDISNVVVFDICVF